MTSITSEEAESYALGVQSELMEPEDQIVRQMEIRHAAKMSFAKADSSRRARAALLRKSVPLRGPYAPGDLVCFHRRNRWHGPGRQRRPIYLLDHTCWHSKCGCGKPDPTSLNS